jgi:hypothetical protein
MSQPTPFRRGWPRRLAGLAALAVLAGGLAAPAAAPAATVQISAPAAASPLAQPLASPERVSYTVPSSNVTRKIAPVDCPNGKTVIGTGWTTNPSSPELLVEDLIPTEYGVTAIVREDETGYASSWSLTVHAVCAYRPPGWTIEYAYSTTTSNPVNLAPVDCPLGTVLLGGGFELSEQAGHIVLTDLNFGGSGATALAYEDDTGYAGTWWVLTYAICAEEPVGWEFVGSSNQTAYPTTTESSGCTAGKMAVSVGADLDYAYGEVTLKGLKTFTYAGADSGTAYAAEDEDGTTSSWDLIAEVVCASA